MIIKLFHKQPEPPGSGEHTIPSWAQWNAQYSEAEEADSDPWFRGKRGRIVADLRTTRLRDTSRAQASRELDEALLDKRYADEARLRTDTEASYPIQAGLTARHDQGPLAAHLRSEGTRATIKRDANRQSQQEADRRANDRNVALRTVLEETTETMRIEAAAALSQSEVHRYFALLNAERAKRSRPNLPPLPTDLADQLVREAFEPLDTGASARRN